MFSKLTASFTAVTALAVLAAATPTPQASGCATGQLQCCQSVQSSTDTAVGVILALLGVVLQDLDLQVGLTCTPITVVGIGSGNACSANTVCCENNNTGGLISIGCVPVSGV